MVIPKLDPLLLLGLICTSVWIMETVWIFPQWYL